MVISSVASYPPQDSYKSTFYPLATSLIALILSETQSSIESNLDFYFSTLPASKYFLFLDAIN